MARLGGVDDQRGGANLLDMAVHQGEAQGRVDGRRWLYLELREYR